ncbi:MAG: YraN family protein [Thermodesulfobacteriota bacterium]|nr:YraN family protein [Thermodesulfobacteriota bacterium]
MAGSNRNFGKQAEQAACVFLEQKGYSIVERNYRTRSAEIDIIARYNAFLVFIEVKARQGQRMGSAREAVTPVKQKKISLGAAFYLRENNLGEVRTRFDVIAVTRSRNDFEIEHIENAFQFFI